MTATIHQFFEWPYLARIAVTNPQTSSAYQSVIDLAWREGMNPDFSDLRFFNLAGEKLPYCIEEKTDGATAKVWIRGAVDREVFLLFGNPSAESESTTDVFDLYHGASTDQFYDTPSLVFSSMIYEASVKWTATGYNLIWGVANKTVTSGADLADIQFFGATIYYYSGNNGSTLSRSTGFSSVAHQYYAVKIVHDGAKVVGYINGTPINATGITTPYLPDEPLGLFFHPFTGAGAQAWSRVRRYAATEPTLTASGITEPNPYWPPESPAALLLLLPFKTLTLADLEAVYSIEISSTGSDIALTYHILRAGDLIGVHQIEILNDLLATYQIEVLKDLLTTYHILIKQEALLPYDIPGGVTFSLVYSVLAEAVLDYRINVGDQVYDPERFWDLVITRKLNQVHTATFELWTDGADVSGVQEGATLRIFYNDEVRFSGEIRSIRKDDMSGIWSVECESGACRLADDAVQGVLDFQATPGDQILRAVLPSPAWEGEIDPAPAIDYRQEYADSLSHVSNLASVLGYDWRVRQQEDRYQVTARTETTITVASAGWPTSPQALAGRVVVVTSGTAKFRAGVVTSHTADTLTFAGTAWTTDGLKVGDAIRVFGPFRLDCKKRIGAEVPRKTFAVNQEIFDSSTSRDLERVANAIVVPGTASITQDRNSQISGNTLLMTPIAVTEAVLRLNLSSSATTVPVDSTASFPASGTIQIENERIAYTEKTATSFTGCTRGYGGSSPAAHNLQTEVVLVSSLPVESTEGFPAAGTVWVGIEKIAYTAKAATAFLSLTRGVDGTEIYAHRAGVLARCGSYTDDDPEPGSSVALYGVRRRVVPALGVLDQNTLDLLAQERLLALQDLKVWGSGIVIDSAFLEDIDVGDEIAIAPEDGGDAESYRLVGVVWRQMTGEIEIEYGAVREYFLEDLSRLQKGVDLANARGAVAMLGTVLSVSSNGEVAQVLLDDGTTVWARIR